MHTDSPHYIQFYPTLKCNFACAFCFNRGISEETEITVSDLERIISIFLDIGVKEIDMLGGEPTLHPDFNQLIDVIYKKKLKVTISTNGSNTEPLVRISNKYNNSLVKIGVSLNSDVVSEELHKYITQYKPVVKSVCLKERTIPDTAKSYIGLSGIEYYLLFMDTVCKEDLKNSLPFYEFIMEIHRLKNIYGNVGGVYCSGFIPDTENYPVLENARCPAGTVKIAVMPDGTVYPCYLFFKHKEFSLGNILLDDFKSIWENPILRFFRRFEKNTCIRTECELHSVCHGGCPAVSFLIYGDIAAPDPRCVEQ